ncbi:NirD/YgiW/YdeI family stress tolerance protein [Ignatzschineria rhizosphaerae]|uniref:NirD/YgiW/YdeI family stress tolerance protein n=1 Tax=Ignatzschineria rhizosphaerae TaxID=2923279 RepID=A0ABY3WYT2_9GAMM|nr:NirD/YgiW/YdeI family stress tolerance protein [Ignatzschineria rhizosphaerae]UNM95783.1 NirD/YgiW/YdeI family stress tolerance protein [Ignatzschineria rhizosphaerae]
MKKLLIAMVFMGLATSAQAQFTGSDVGMPPQDLLISPFEISKVEAVRQMPDDTYVTVVGHIIAQQGRDRDKYLFQDETGEIIVEIDKKLWRNQPVSPETTVKILGELDQSRHQDRVKIEAVYLEVIQ